uniref:Bone morphogenetic protein 3B n=1 Tax=Lygus hesperus TaxID=30085 RepID=A0A0A9XX12_LYGHE
MKMPHFITATFLLFTMKGHVVEVGAGKQTVINKVSHGEYESKMKMFINQVKGTIQETIHEVILPKGIENQGTGNELVKFNHKNFATANQHTLRMSVTGASQVTVYQVASDGKEVELGTESLDNGHHWVGVHLNKHPSEELVVRISCGSGCKIADPKLNSFSHVTVHSGGRTLRTEDRSCAPNVTAKTTTCCKQKADVDLRAVEGLPQNIEGPTWLQFAYCIGGCPINFNYASEHARLRHLVERKYHLPNMDQDPCLPTKMNSIKVLRVNEQRTALEIVEWKNVTAHSCACY